MSKSKTTTIKEYYTKNGKKQYMFKIYLGIDPLTGNPKSTTRRFKTLPEAKRALTQMKFEIQNGTYHRQQVETYQEVYDLWIKQYERNVEESTFVKTTGIFRNHILPAVGNYRITKMNFSVCQKHVNEWANKLKKARIVKSYASKVLDFAIKIGYIQTNPFALVEVPSSSKSTQYGDESKKSYTKEQLITFLQCMKQESNTKAYTLFHLLAYSGMRKSEALALTWKDIDFNINEIRINKALGRGKENKLYIKPTKTGNPRTIKIDSTTTSILKEWKKQQRQNHLILGYNTMQSNQLVFSNMKNEFLQPTVTNKWLKSVLTKYKLSDITTHGFRHTHCSLLLEANVRLKEVSDRLGHRDAHTTLNVYAHVSEQAKSDTVNKFEMFMAM
ncbi:tyrosine-type recombinase/integrase [Bacillus sp. Cr_A10]|uniref:tyrosine-type recombinase/integrase n=1 Tax=Bacillus sp. Cr_A10 TaxID=3033993 RepID=UPI0023DAF545|nr:tyrosine-type recombinase/integrase [Bacillus sp. Cr_A10]MDF2065108.1 tyrosine-type recombinase/integrase [Bacillus sp. Cr_A10]